MSTISVIVPVYKVEKYLPQCIDSILAQTYKDFELILIDDGSPDNCGKMCDEYAQRDARVRVIHQKNGGLSAARNAGIDMAKGEYIAFVDSDDYVSEEYLEKLYNCLVYNNADISICDKIEFWSDKAIQTVKDNGKQEKMTGREACTKVYQIGKGVSIIACCKLYNKRLFEGRRFPVGMIHEDQAVVPILLYNADVVSTVNECLYYYRQHNESIMRKKFTPKRFDNVLAIDRCIKYFSERNENNIICEALKCRNKIIAQSVLLAYDDAVEKTIPRKYMMSKNKALMLLDKSVPHDFFTNYLSKYYPIMVRPYCYLHRFKRLLGLEKEYE